MQSKAGLIGGVALQGCGLSGVCSRRWQQWASVQRRRRLQTYARWMLPVGQRS